MLHLSALVHPATIITISVPMPYSPIIIFSVVLIVGLVAIRLAIRFIPFLG